MKLNKINKLMFTKKGVYLILSLIFLLLLVINYYTIWAADDYANYNSVWTSTNNFSFSAILDNTIELYFGLTGRFLSTFLNRIFLFFNKNLFNIINSVVYTMLILVIYKIVKKENQENAWLLGLIFMFTWLFVPAVGQVMFWQIGSVIYLWMFFLVSILTLLFTNLLKNIKVKNTFINNVLILILSILAGNGLETNSLILLAYIAFVILYKLFIQKEKVPLWAWIGFIGTIIGLITNVIAPGNMNRMDSMNVGDTLFSKVLYGVGYVIYNGLFRSKIYILIAILIISYCIYIISQKSKFQLNRKFFIPFLSITIFITAFLTIFFIMYPINYDLFLTWFWGNVYKFWYILMLVTTPLIVAIISIIKNHKEFFKETNKTSNALILFLVVSSFIGIAAYILAPLSWPRSYMGMSLYLIIAIVYILPRIKYNFKYLNKIIYIGISSLFIISYLFLLKDVYFSKKWNDETKKIINEKIANNEEIIYVKTFVSENSWNAASVEKWVIPIHMEEGNVSENRLPLYHEWINKEVTNYYFKNNNAWNEGKRIKGYE